MSIPWVKEEALPEYKGATIKAIRQESVNHKLLGNIKRLVIEFIDGRELIIFGIE